MIFNNKVENRLGLKYYSGGSSNGSGTSNSTSSGSGSSTAQSTSNPQLTPEQMYQMYGSALPSIANVTNQTAGNSLAAPATNAAVKGGAAGVNAINLNGLSPGEYNSTERALNQSNTATGNLGLNNGMNTITNAQNFGGAFNSKLGLLDNAVGAASGASNAANTTTGTTASLFNPIASSGNATNSQSTSSSMFGNSAQSAGNTNQSAFNVGCFLTTAVCEWKGLPDDCEELTILRKFRDEHVDPFLVQEYYKIAPRIVEAIKQMPTVYEYIWNTIKDCISHIKSEQFEMAIGRYRMMVDTLKHISNI